MTLVSPSQSNPNDEITAASVNNPVNQIAAVVNGNIDSTNISSLSGSKVQAGTLNASAMDTATNVETRMSESLGNFVASGCTWSAISGLNGTMTSGVVYVNGRRVVVSAIASRAFTASKDTYISVDINGTVSYSEVANNAAAPSVPANSVFVSVVISGASTISAINDIRKVPDTGWIDLSMASGVTSDTDRPLRYKKVGDLVYVCGRALKTAGNFASTDIGTLPVGYRPYGGRADITFTPGAGSNAIYRSSVNGATGIINSGGTSTGGSFIDVIITFRCVY